MKRRLWILCSALALTSGPLRANEPRTDLDGFEREVEPLLKKYCLDCHGPDKEKGDIRIDTLNPDLFKGTDGDHWEEVLNQLNLGDMPPEDDPQPSRAERDAITSWLQEQMKLAAAFRSGASKRTGVRRLTRYEFNYTLQDLLGVDIDHAGNMPEDRADADGLRNNAQLLGMSPVQFELALDAAGTALRKALVAPEEPLVHEHRFEAEKEGNARGFDSAPKEGELLKLLPGTGQLVRIKERPREGRFQIRAKVGGKPDADGIPPRLQVWLGFQATGVVYAREMLADVPVTASLDNPKVMSFEGYIENFPQAFVLDAQDLEKIGKGKESREGLIVWMVGGGTSELPNPESLDRQIKSTRDKLNPKNDKKKPDEKAAAKLEKQLSELEARQAKMQVEFDAKVGDVGYVQLDWYEFEGPYFEAWPPPSRVAALGEAAPDSGKPADRARAALTTFASRAWRRPVQASEIEPFARAFDQFHAESQDFDTSIKDALSLVLATPEFLYLVNPDESTDRALDDHELASRLSYFLWSSLPDDELRDLADHGKLRDESVLAAQVRRMLADPKAKRLARHFSEQWLGLDQITRVAVNPEYFPKFRPETKASFRQEAIEYLWHIMRDQRSALELLDSDYVVIDEILAAHYGLEGVRGSEFRPVAVRPEDHRGGLLGMGGFMLAHSDGAHSHPIFRGKWLLQNVLNDPPPPPPPNVPELDQADPEFAKLSKKDQLAFHREVEACASCHDKLDPWGLALENFDAVGSWRDSTVTRSSQAAAADTEEAVGDKKRNRREKGRESKSAPAAVDAAVEMPDGTPVDGFGELKKYLVETQTEVFSEGLVRRLLAYSLGRSLDWTDREEVKRLTEGFADSGYRLDSLITEIVLSKPFNFK